MIRYAIALGVVLMLSWGSMAHSNTIRVDWSGGGNFTTIQQGIDAAGEGDTVLVAPGTYAGAMNRDINFYLTNRVLIAEAGAGETIIDREQLGRGFYLGSNVVDASSVIDGFTVTGGVARDDAEDGGGAVYLSNAEPIIRNCVFTGNDGAFGGAMKIAASDALIESCVFVGNTADYGGGLATRYCRPTIQSCLFHDNIAAEDGGGFHVYFYSPTLRNCTLVRNSSPLGGGLGATGTPGAPYVDRCIIALSPEGAALNGSVADMVHCIVFGNAGGDELHYNAHDCLIEHPLFCNPDLDDFTVCSNSPALPAGNEWQVAIGSENSGCGDCAAPVEPGSWGGGSSGSSGEARFRPLYSVVSPSASWSGHAIA